MSSHFWSELWCRRQHFLRGRWHDSICCRYRQSLQRDTQLWRSYRTHCYYYQKGQTIVLFNEKDKRQRFIQGPEIIDSITAFAVGSGKRWLYESYYSIELWITSKFAHQRWPEGYKYILKYDWLRSFDILTKFHAKVSCCCRTRRPSPNTNFWFAIFPQKENSTCSWLLSLQGSGCTAGHIFSFKNK